MRVFYFTDATCALSDIALGRIKVSRISELNDPYELMAVKTNDKEIRSSLIKLKIKINETHGILCFSKSWENPMLWSHYSDKHKGICLGFDINDSKVVPVGYISHRLQPEGNIIGDKVTRKFFDKLMSTKFAHWSYEEEVRLFIKLDKISFESGMYFYDYDSDIMLFEVILGPNCRYPIGKIRKLVNLLHDIPPESVKKSRLADKTFRVIEI